LRREHPPDAAALHQVIAVLNDLAGEVERPITDVLTVGLIGWSSHAERAAQSLPSEIFGKSRDCQTAVAVPAVWLAL
jgi:hypothetical protein